MQEDGEVFEFIDRDDNTAAPLSRVSREFSEIFDRRVFRLDPMSFMTSLGLLCWAIFKGYKLSVKTADLAAEAGNLAILKWMKECGFEFSVALIQHAMSGGNLDVIDYLTSKNIWTIVTPGFEIAARKGHVHVFEWFEQRGVHPTSIALDAAAKHGQAKMFMWLRSRGKKCDAATFCCAVVGKNREIIDHLISVRCPFDRMLYHQAAWNLDIEVLLYMKNLGEIMLPDLYCRAMDLNDTQKFQSLWNHHFPWEQGVILYAILHNSLSFLGLMKEWDWEFPPNIYNVAIDRDSSFETILWLHNNVRPWANYVLMLTVRERKFGIFKKMIEHGCPRPPELPALLEHWGWDEMLFWLRKFDHSH